METPFDRIDPRARDAFSREIERRKIDLAPFDVRVNEMPLGYIVYTVAKRRPANPLRRTNGYGEIEARISKATFEVIDVTLLR